MNRPLIMEGANLFVGNDPTASNHLILSELRLPSLERNYVDHAAGGGAVAIEVDTHLNKLEASFTLAGWQPQVIGFIHGGDQTFQIYGLVRDRRSGRALEAMAIIQGRIGRVTPSPYSRGTVMGHDYAIRAIMHYTLTLDFQPIFSWDWYSNSIFTNQSNEMLGMLGMFQRGFGDVFGF